MGFLILFLIANGCDKNSFKGTIDNREGTLYLVNMSKDRAYQFTLKIETKLNEKIVETTTQVIGLVPGEERLLSVSSYTLPLEYPTIQDTLYYTIDENGKPIADRPLTVDEAIDIFEQSKKQTPRPIGKEERKKIKLPRGAVLIEDTSKILNFIIISKLDSLNPYPSRKYEYNYKIVGQLDFTNKVRIKDNN